MAVDACSRPLSPRGWPKDSSPWPRCELPKSSSGVPSSTPSRSGTGTARSIPCSRTACDAPAAVKAPALSSVKLVAMPRSRKSSGQPPANQDVPDADQGDAATMAHVSADELSGSPDIFTAKRSSGSSLDAQATEETSPTMHSSDASSEDVPAAAPEPPATTSEPIAAPLEPPASSVQLPPPMTPAPPHVPPPPPARRNGAG